MELASLTMATPPKGIRAIDHLARWEARKALHDIGRLPCELHAEASQAPERAACANCRPAWPVLEPRPSQNRFASIAMAHGQLPDGTIANDGVPLALSKPEFVQLLEAGQPLPQPLVPHTHNPYCERIALIVDESDGEPPVVIESLDGSSEGEATSE